MARPGEKPRHEVYLIYDSSTGEVARRLECPADHVSGNTNSGESWIVAPGDENPATHWVDVSGTDTIKPKTEMAVGTLGPLYTDPPGDDPAWLFFINGFSENTIVTTYGPDGEYDRYTETTAMASLVFETAGEYRVTAYSLKFLEATFTFTCSSSEALNAVQGKGIAGQLTVKTGCKVTLTGGSGTGAAGTLTVVPTF